MYVVSSKCQQRHSSKVNTISIFYEVDEFTKIITLLLAQIHNFRIKKCYLLIMKLNFSDVCIFFSVKLVLF